MFLFFYLCVIIRALSSLPFLKMNQSHNDQGGDDIDVMTGNIISESSNPSQSADADDDTSKEEVSEETTENTEETEETTETDESSPEVHPENTLTDEASDLVENIAKLSEDKRQDKIKNLEKSGRQHHLEAAKVLREMYGGESEQPVVNEEVITKAVENKLKEMGLDPESIQSQKQDQEKNARNKALSSLIEDRGLDIDPSAVSKNIDFVKTFYDPKYEGLDMDERTMIAFNKVNKKTIPQKSKTGGVPSGAKQVQAERKKTIDDMDKRELDSFIYNASLEDFGIKN